MCQQQKIIFNAVGFPIPRRFAAVMLLFYNQFLERKTYVLKRFHYVEAHWNNTPLFSRISHKYCAKLSVL